MVCIEDHAHFLAWSGLLISTLAYLSPCAATKAWWLKWLLGALAAEMAYAALAAWFPDVFATDLWTSAGTCAGLFLVIMLAFSSAASIMLLGTVLLLLGPFVAHQVMQLTAWLRANVSHSLPPWTGVALFVALLLGALALAWTLRLVRAVRYVVYVVVGAVLEFVYIRTVWIEAGAATTNLCCDWSNGDEVPVYDAASNTTQMAVVPRDNSRCPLDTSSVANGMLLAALLFFAVAQAAFWHEAKKRRREEVALRSASKRKQPAASGAAATRYAKVHASPEPDDTF